jgi:hypothetical protein
MTEPLLTLNDIYYFNLKGKRIERKPFRHPLPNERSRLFILCVNMEKDFVGVKCVQTAAHLSVSIVELNMNASHVKVHLYVTIKKLDQRVLIVVALLLASISYRNQSVKSVKGVLFVNTEIKQDVHWDVVVVLVVYMGNAKSIVGKDAVVALSVDMDATNGDVRRKGITYLANTKKIDYIV